jgi:hypothetical protein
MLLFFFQDLLYREIFFSENRKLSFFSYLIKECLLKKKKQIVIVMMI